MTIEDGTSLPNDGFYIDLTNESTAATLGDESSAANRPKDGSKTSKESDRNSLRTAQMQIPDILLQTPTPRASISGLEEQLITVPVAKIDDDRKESSYKKVRKESSSSDSDSGKSTKRKSETETSASIMKYSIGISVDNTEDSEKHVLSEFKVLMSEGKTENKRDGQVFDSLSSSDSELDDKSMKSEIVNKGIEGDGIHIQGGHEQLPQSDTNQGIEAKLWPSKDTIQETSLPLETRLSVVGDGVKQISVKTSESDSDSVTQINLISREFSAAKSDSSSDSESDTESKFMARVSELESNHESALLLTDIHSEKIIKREPDNDINAKPESISSSDSDSDVQQITFLGETEAVFSNDGVHSNETQDSQGANQDHLLQLDMGSGEVVLARSHEEDLEKKSSDSEQDSDRGSDDNLADKVVAIDILGTVKGQLEEQETTSIGLDISLHYQSSDAAIEKDLEIGYDLDQSRKNSSRTSSPSDSGCGTHDITFCSMIDESISVKETLFDTIVDVEVATSKSNQSSKKSSRSSSPSNSDSGKHNITVSAMIKEGIIVEEPLFDIKVDDEVATSKSNQSSKESSRSSSPSDSESGKHNINVSAMMKEDISVEEPESGLNVGFNLAPVITSNSAERKTSSSSDSDTDSKFKPFSESISFNIADMRLTASMEPGSSNQSSYSVEAKQAEHGLDGESKSHSDTGARVITMSEVSQVQETSNEIRTDADIEFHSNLNFLPAKDIFKNELNDMELTGEDVPKHVSTSKKDSLSSSDSETEQNEVGIKVKDQGITHDTKQKPETTSDYAITTATIKSREQSMDHEANTAISSDGANYNLQFRFKGPSIDNQSDAAYEEQMHG